MAKMVKKDAERLLAAVPANNAFWCCDGHTLRSMRELETALIDMADETFAYHSNADKADFSTWVGDAVGDDKLARDLAKSPNRSQAAKCAKARIAFLEHRVGLEDSWVRNTSQPSL